MIKEQMTYEEFRAALYEFEHMTLHWQASKHLVIKVRKAEVLSALDQAMIQGYLQKDSIFTVEYEGIRRMVVLDVRLAMKETEGTQ